MLKDSHHQNFFDQITSSLIEAVIIIDKKGIIQTVNSAVADLFGYSQDELSGENVRILMPEDEAGKHDSYIDNYNKTGKAKILNAGREVKGQHKDSTIFILNLKVNNINIDGEEYFLGILYNIQERIEFNEEIQNQKELLERAEEIGQLGHWRVDLVNNSVFWSKEIYRIHGVTNEHYDPELQSAIDFYHPDDRERVAKFVQEAIENQENFKFEARLVQPSGEVRYVRSAGECNIGKNGNVTSLFGVFLDITDLVEARQKLQISDNRYRQATEGANVGLWDWNIVTNEVHFNHQWYTLLGYEPYELPVAFDTFEALTHPDDFKVAMGVLSAHMEGEEEGYKIIIRMKHKSGHWVWIMTTGQVMERDANGNAIRASGIHLDVTDSVNSEEALRQANEELEEFAYRTSHDLRSPLLSSVSLLSMAKRSIQEHDDETALKSIEHVENSLEKLEALVHDILVLTQTKNIEEEDTEIDVEEIVDSAFAKFSNMDNASRIDIRKNLDARNNLSLKKSRFILIAENMISNAIKYQDPSEKTSFIEISSYEKDNNFILKIEDNGLGIPDDQHDKIFQMFKRFHNKVAFGSGLGLYMMKKSANILGGDITYEQPKKGAIFKLVIPL